jgi:hypothetical protein
MSVDMRDLNIPSGEGGSCVPSSHPEATGGVYKGRPFPIGPVRKSLFPEGGERSVHHNLRSVSGPIRIIVFVYSLISFWRAKMGKMTELQNVTACLRADRSTTGHGECIDSYLDNV